jgi:alpha-L-glutamate ligase-like protein
MVFQRQRERERGMSMVKEILRRIGKPPVLGMNRRNLELVSSRNERRHFVIADDKLLAKQWLERASVKTSPTLATFDSFYEIGFWRDKLQGLDEFVVKPARGSGGRGILVIAERRDDLFITAGGNILTPENLIRHIGDIVFGVYALDKADVAIVEPRLKPDPFFAALFENGLSDMRLIFADDEFALCMIRVPTKASDGRANLHQGAIGIGVDSATGMTYRAVQKGRLIETHPETGVSLINLQVPSWNEVVEIAKAAAAALPLKYLGVDMVVDKDLGPLILEVNARPGIEIQNVTGRSLLSVLREHGVLEQPW